jgi:hypothetical protein
MRGDHCQGNGRFGTKYPADGTILAKKPGGEHAIRRHGMQVAEVRFHIPGPHNMESRAIDKVPRGASESFHWRHENLSSSTDIAFLNYRIMANSTSSHAGRAGLSPMATLDRMSCQIWGQSPSSSSRFQNTTQICCHFPIGTRTPSPPSGVRNE